MATNPVQNHVVIIASIVGLFMFVATAVSIRLIWYRSNWRREQIYSLERVDLFVASVVAASDRPGSGLSVTELGDLAGDWARVRAELAARYTFGAWVKRGRMTHVMQDRQARALSTLARHKTDPLLAKLSKASTGRLSPSLITEVIEVLSLNLDDLVAATIRVIKLSAPQTTPEPATPATGITLMRKAGPNQTYARLGDIGVAVSLYAYGPLR